MKALPNLRRFSRVLHLAIRHSAIHFAGRCLARWPRIAHRVCGQPLSGPERLKLMIEETGGTFLKFGQMLALQSDLLPLEYCRVLYTLFDSMAPFPYEQVEEIFREELQRRPKEIFDSFDIHPVATGSIGQVHAAVLGGHKVAVKIRRPNIVSDFIADTTALKSILGMIKLLRIRGLYWIITPVEEFIAWTEEELDFRREAYYMEELRRNARENWSEKVPVVYWSCTTARILTAEFLEGMTISEYLRKRPSAEIPVAPEFDSKVFSRNLIDNFLGDAFRHGMFHADLHPGNLIIMGGNVVGYIDFGISGVLSRYSRRYLISMTLAYARGDLDGMCESFFHITTRDNRANVQHFRQRLREVSAAWYGTDPTQGRLRKSITSIMLDLLVLSRENGIWPQRDVIKYIRSAVALDGLIKTFSPGMDIGRHLEAVCERHLKWDSLRSLTSPDTVAGWFGGYANLARDGMLRTMSLLRRLANQDFMTNQFFAAQAGRTSKSRRWIPALYVLWIAACVMMMRKTGQQIFTGHGIYVLALVAAVAVVSIVWWARKQEPAIEQSPRERN